MHTQDSGGLETSPGHGVAAPALFLWNHRDSGEEKRSTCKYRTVELWKQDGGWGCAREGHSAGKETRQPEALHPWDGLRTL